MKLSSFKNILPELAEMMHILSKVQRGKLFTPCDFPRNVTNAVIKLREKFDIVYRSLKIYLRFYFACIAMTASVCDVK